MRSRPGSSLRTGDSLEGRAEFYMEEEPERPRILSRPKSSDPKYRSHLKSEKSQKVGGRDGKGKPTVNINISVKNSSGN
jgi:hypothetical protein